MHGLLQVSELCEEYSTIYVHEAKRKGHIACLSISGKLHSWNYTIVEPSINNCLIITTLQFKNIFTR